MLNSGACALREWQWTKRKRELYVAILTANGRVSIAQIALDSSLIVRKCSSVENVS